MSTEENKAVVLRLWEEVINEGNYRVADEHFAPAYVYHSPDMPDVNGPGGFKELIAMFRAAFPDAHVTVEDWVAEGDKVACRWRGIGTHRGTFMGVPPTGKIVTVSGMLISHFAAGKIVEEWGLRDMLGVARQLGVIPALRGTEP